MEDALDTRIVGESLDCRCYNTTKDNHIAQFQGLGATILYQLPYSTAQVIVE